MAKITVNLGGKVVNMNTNNPKVAGAIAALIQACAERRFGIGTFLTHHDEDGRYTKYQLVRIANLEDGTVRAYLINQKTGKARNSTKVVPVMNDDANFPNGYVTTLPCVKDKFLDPENPGCYIPLDD